MTSKHLKKQLVLAGVSLLLLVIAITAGTYAWFSFNTATRVDPISSTVSGGGANLMIANTSAGPFERECSLVFSTQPETMRPVSTPDLVNYFQVTAQNRDGVALLYRDATAQADTYLIRGTLYLQSTGGTNQVYFQPSNFQLGADAQTQASLRLGMRITVNGQEFQYIFRMDGFSGGGAESHLTVPSANTVVGSIDSAGNPAYISDPARSIADFMAVEQSPQDPAPSAGSQSLCVLGDGQVATVEYWVYLEGCDENCVESVQSRELPIQLGFAGVSQEGEG